MSLRLIGPIQRQRLITLVWRHGTPAVLLPLLPPPDAVQMHTSDVILQC